MDALNFLARKEEMEKEINELKALIEEKQRSLDSLVAFQNKHSLSNHEVSRYSRQILLPQIGVHGQEKIKQGSVLIIGCGGLGCPAAQYLAGCGVGRIGLVDYDTVEENNLHRQVLHGENSIGQSKVKSAADALKRLNSKIRIDEYPVQLNSLNALQIMQPYSVVIDASDNPSTRYLVNDACIFAKLPLVSGSAVGMEGQLTVYNFNGGPCYRCLYPIPTPPQMVTNCGDAGVLGPIPGVIGVLQALQAIHILIGSESVFNQKLLLFDGVDCLFRQVKLRGKSRECTVCGENPSITRLIDYEQFCGAPANDKMNKKGIKRPLDSEEDPVPIAETQNITGQSDISVPGPSKKPKTENDESETIEVLMDPELVDILLQPDADDGSRDENSFSEEGNTQDSSIVLHGGSESMSPTRSVSGMSPNVRIASVQSLISTFGTPPQSTPTILMNSEEPIDFFLHIFTDKFFDLIIKETNFQAILLMSQATEPKFRIQGWKALTKGELEVFLGLLFLIGHFNAPSLSHYWQADDLYNFPIFRNAMSIERFLLILRTLNFAGNPLVSKPNTSDPLYKISPLFNLFHERMKEIYFPPDELSPDESMFIWRGRLYFRQHVQYNNPNKFGFKFYMLTQPDSLVLKTRLYYGTNDGENFLEDLVDEYFGVGHTVLLDNFHPYEKHSNSTDNLQENSKGNLLKILHKKLKRVQLASSYSSVGIRVQKLLDKMTSDIDPVIKQKKSLLNYDEFTEGPDRSELFTNYNISERLTLRWYVKLALNLFHIMMSNAFILYRKQPEKGNTKWIDFRESVINELIYRNRQASDVPDKLPPIGVHVLSQVPRNEKNRLIRKRCVYCSKNRKRVETTYFCAQCKEKPGLCLEPCFRKFHGY